MLTSSKNYGADSRVAPVKIIRIVIVDSRTDPFSSVLVYFLSSRVT